MIAAERQVRVGGAVLIGGSLGTGCARRRRGSRRHGGIAGSEAGRLRQRGEPLQSGGRFARIVESAFESDARVVGRRARIRGDRRGGRSGLPGAEHGEAESEYE